MEIRTAGAADKAWIERTLVESWGSTGIALRDAMVDAMTCPALVAGDRQGLLHYRTLDGDTGEILTLEAFEPGRGIGSALVEACADRGLELGWRKLVVVTTNDNTDALRFYQRRGFVLSVLRPDAVTRLRLTVKPGIPETAANGIAIRDEIELTRFLVPFRHRSESRRL